MLELGDQVVIDGLNCYTSLSSGIPIHVVYSERHPIRCFGIEAIKSESLYRCRDRTAGCNCIAYSFCPHANGTHLETQRHVDPSGPRPIDVMRVVKPLLYCVLLQWPGPLQPSPLAEAVILKTGWVESQIRNGMFDFSGTNPPYLIPKDVRSLFEAFPKLKFLIVDLPSIDPESDNGALLAHRVFFDSGGWGVIEIADLSNASPGDYLLALNVALFDGDACPCSPVIFRAKFSSSTSSTPST